MESLEISNERSSTPTTPSPSRPSPTRKACSTLTSTTRLIIGAVAAVAYYTVIACSAVAYLIRGSFDTVWYLGVEEISKVIHLTRRVMEIVVPFIIIVGAKWERAFILSCIAVSLDPLFFYIPIIDETNKCLAADNNLRIISVVLRSFTDFLLITHIVAQILDKVETDYPKYLAEDSESNPDSDKEFDIDPEDPFKLITDRLPWLTFSVMINFLAIIPIPQVAILVGFFRMKGSDFFALRKFVNISIVLQYLPRVCQIYLTKSKFRMAGKWAKPCFNLFLYILASHILGALWYFTAIERETSCWHKACIKTPGCVSSSYNCGGSGGAKDVALLDQLCPIVKSPNSTQFDYGIFVDVLQSGNTESKNFATKLMYSLWWGLKNLSNFGTNLDTSSYLWENCFAVLICVIGLLLFLYLIGNVQLYIQSATQKSLDKENSRTQKIQEKREKITQWMELMKETGLEKVMRTKIKQDITVEKYVERSLSHNVDVDVKYFFNPKISNISRFRTPMLEHLGVAALKKVHNLKSLNETELKSLCQFLEPVVYMAATTVVRKDVPLDKMLFIIRGGIERDDLTGKVNAGEYFGQEIVEWASFNYKMRSCYDPPPFPTKAFISRAEKVEALALKAWDLLRFLEKINFDIDDAELNKLSHKEADHPVPSDLSWQCPEPEWRKLNCCSIWTDKSKKAAFGSVLRKERGAYVVAFSAGGQPCMDKFQAEAISIKFAMQYCLGPGVLYSGRLVVESEDEHLIACLTKGPSFSEDQVRSNLRSTLKDIVLAASKFKECKFVHCQRQTNEAARLVANHAVNVPDSLSRSTSVPSDIHGLDDALKKDSPNLEQTSRQEQNKKSAPKVDTEASTASAAAAVARNPKDSTSVKQSTEA